jgi:hypothetical protein
LSSLIFVLTSETQALAERICESDPIFTRLVKLSVNQVQDAAGFRVAVQSAFSNFMLLQQAGLVWTEKEKEEGKRRISRVDRALKYLKKEG